MGDGVLFMIMNKDCQGLAIASMLFIWFCFVSSCCLVHSFGCDYNQTYIICKALIISKYRVVNKRMYKHPVSKTIAPELTTNLSRLQPIYNIYDNNIACIGTLDDDQNMCCTNLNSKKKGKQKWIVRYWNCLHKEASINEWQVKIERGFEIGQVVAVQKQTYALWILPKNMRKLNKTQEKQQLQRLQQYILIMQVPMGQKMEVPTYHKMPIKSIKSNGIIVKEQNFFQVKRSLSYEHRLNALVCVWQLSNKQAEVVQLNNLIHANHHPSFIVRLTYISLSHLLPFQRQPIIQIQIGSDRSRQFYLGFRNATKSYKIIHPFLDLFATHPSQLIRSVPLLICYEPIPILPSHMLQAVDRRLSLSIFSMTKDAFYWPNPLACKVVYIQGYILGVDNTPEQLGANDQQGQAQIGQIDEEQQEWVDEQENDQNQQNENQQNVNQLVNGLIVERQSLDIIVNLTVHTTHNKKQKLLNVGLNLQKWQGIVKNVSQFPFESSLNTVLSVGGNVSYVWSLVACFNQNNMLESHVVYLMGLENNIKYKLIQKQLLKSSTKHPNIYIDDQNEISMLETAPVFLSPNQSIKKEEQFQIWKMGSKKVIYMQMLKQIFGKGQDQETDVFVDVLAQSTLALL